MDNWGEFLMISDTVKIKGFVEIKNGDTIIKAENKFVQTTLQLIINWLSMTHVPTNWNVGSYGPTYIYNMYIGTDITTATLFNTSALISPIGTAPGTAPNAKGGVTSNPSNGVFRIIITATWNAGTVSGMVGEMALYLNLLSAPTNLKVYGWSDVVQPTSAVLASRLAVADGAFSPFTINTANPLTITWTIQLSFV